VLYDLLGLSYYYQSKIGIATYFHERFANAVIAKREYYPDVNPIRDQGLRRLEGFHLEIIQL